MAGTNSSFRATAFRTGVRFAMNMGTPPNGADALKFYWNPTVTSTGLLDGDGVPFDPSAPVTRTPTKAPLTKPCAVEFLDAAGEPTNFGVVIPSKVRVTLLDEDYKAVKDADYVVIRGDKYVRWEQPPSYGLFDVGIYQMVFAAENEV